jgi:hypothetical protein
MITFRIVFASIYHRIISLSDLLCLLSREGSISKVKDECNLQQHHSIRVRDV